MVHVYLHKLAQNTTFNRKSIGVCDEELSLNVEFMFFFFHNKH